jgi:PIN domain nuclease of toxin-antitoxin system
VETHVLIWYFIGSKRLKRELKGKMDEVRNKGGRLLVPTIVLADSHRRKRQSRI